MTMTTECIICPSCGKHIDRLGENEPARCPACGADMNARMRDEFAAGETDFDYERIDVIEFYEREDWE